VLSRVENRRAAGSLPCHLPPATRYTPKPPEPPPRRPRTAPGPGRLTFAGERPPRTAPEASPDQHSRPRNPDRTTDGRSLEPKPAPDRPGEHPRPRRRVTDQRVRGSEG